MDGKQNYFHDIAMQALGEYDLPGCSSTFIRHSDNVTFRIDTPDSDVFLLRVHTPITTAMGMHGADFDTVNSELLWLEALCQDTDLVLQWPVRNRGNALVTPIITGETHSTVHCSLLHWVDGRPYHRDLESEHTAHQIGEILAKLHLHAGQWEIPHGFNRPKRDIAYFENMLGGLEPAVKDGRISSSDFAVFATSIALLTDRMRSLNQSRRTYGIMHADMHKGNMLFHQSAIRLIDFSFCAFGDFMFDLGICLGDMKEPLHQACLDSYQSLCALPDDYQRLIEGFFIGSIVGTFSFWVANPHATKILKSKVPQIARDYAARFNREEHFWFA